MSASGSALVAAGARCSAAATNEGGGEARGCDERARTPMHPRVISTGVVAPAGPATGGGEKSQRRAGRRL